MCMCSLCIGKDIAVARKPVNNGDEMPHEDCSSSSVVPNEDNMDTGKGTVAG